jgi:hypothetical protein
VAQPTLHPVADDGRADRAAHGETDTRRRPAAIGVAAGMHDQEGRPRLPAAQGSPKVIGSLEPMEGGEHRERTDVERDDRIGRAAQAASRLRPLRRRADRMERPARVRMRRRKPCVLLRLRLFGWNVRLLIAAISRGHQVGQGGAGSRQVGGRDADPGSTPPLIHNDLSTKP